MKGKLFYFSYLGQTVKPKAYDLQEVYSNEGRDSEAGGASWIVTMR